eukprot:TRINITY_DN36663_c0_g2_i1.p1 TRINITY_DN36663_c0_g2~~TRINITY_DN36663_c0_g2_i1.p1  ORF type:complete len:391 (+),score=66.92 TRINITY_DN36663_c0_g2_i1:201-1373(+)
MHRSLLHTLALAAVIASAHSWSCANSPTNATIMTLTRLTDPLAVCNDGSQAGYYYKEGTDPQLWLVYLAGGDWCYDAESCAARKLLPHVGNGGYNGSLHTSSVHFPSSCPKTGVFSELKGAALARANKVYIPYCTSDAHMGDRPGSEATNGWHFRGQRVVSAVLKELESKHWGGQDAEGITMVFGGGSAGGRGAMTLLDSVAERLKVRVLGYLDSNMWMDVASHNQSFMGFAEQTEAAFKWVDARNVVGSQCGLMYKGNEWRCIFGQFRMPFVRTPYLMTASQYDSWQLRFDVCDDLLGCTIRSDAMAYTDSYGMLVQQYLMGFPPVPDGKSAVYSQACYNHHMSESKLFTSTSNSHGMTENDALRVWVNDPQGYNWVDQCQGYECGAGC